MDRDDRFELALRLGRDEVNFAEWPMAALGAERDEQDVLEFSDVFYTQSRQVKRRLVVRSTRGLPRPVDVDVLLALMVESWFQGPDNGFAERVRIDRGRMTRLLGWTRTGPNDRRIDQALRRWVGVELEFDNAWYCPDRKTTIDALMSPIGTYLPEHHEVRWNPDFFGTLRWDRSQALDLQIYRGLSRPVARRLHRFLNNRIRPGEELSIDVEPLGLERVGLSRAYQGCPGRIAYKLRAAVGDLQASGFLEPEPWEHRVTKRGGVPRIHFRRVEGLRHSAGRTESKAKPRSRSNPPRRSRDANDPNSRSKSSRASKAFGMSGPPKTARRVDRQRVDRDGPVSLGDVLGRIEGRLGRTEDRP